MECGVCVGGKRVESESIRYGAGLHPVTPPHASCDQDSLSQTPPHPHFGLTDTSRPSPALTCREPQLRSGSQQPLLPPEGNGLELQRVLTGT